MSSGTASLWLEDLFTQFGANILGYLRTLVHDVYLAEDIMQNVFMRLHTCYDKRDSIKNIRAFAFTIARREALREISRNVKQANNVTQHQQVFAAKNNSLPTLEVMCLEEALLSLPLEQRETIYLKIYRQLTFQEIASTLDITINTAASRYRYGMEKMQKMLGAENE